MINQETAEPTPEPNVETRSHCPVSILAFAREQFRCYIGAFKHEGEWIACSWFKNGTYFSLMPGGEVFETGLDLVLKDGVIIK